ncbi:MAG: glycosyltransferase family 39 protein [Acidimicrobiales bacterium]
MSVPAGLKQLDIEEMVIGAPSEAPVRNGRFLDVVEAIGVLVSPAVLFFVLRLQEMTPPRLPDPAIFTTFVVDPRDMFIRYSAVFASTSRMREASQVGFVVPARAFYLAFGAVNGFLAFRYLLALVAVAPVYLLLRRTYGRWAGAGGIAVVMSSPVIVSAWGTNYPDSATVSYLLGATCALIMSASEKRRPLWLLLAAVLLTMAVWADGGSVPLVVAALVAYVLVRGLRERRHLLRDAGVLLGGAVAVTGILAFLSGFEIGQFNFITPTLQSERFLSRPYQEALWHSTNWHWLLYDPYLVVPPAVLIAFIAVFLRGYRSITTTQLFLGLCALFEFLTAAYFQFVGKVQLVEEHYFSSMLWAVVLVLLAFVVSEIATALADWDPFATPSRSTSSPLSRAFRVALRSMPFLLVVGVALGYEADRHVPAMKLSPWGLAIGAILVLVAATWRVSLGWDSEHGLITPSKGLVRALGASAILVGLLGANLLLTVAPETHVPTMENVVDNPIQAYPIVLGGNATMKNVVDDPIPTYSMVLGGNATPSINQYQVICELPGFVGHPSYKGEQLLMWWPWRELPQLLSAIGIFHADFNSVHGGFPDLTTAGTSTINKRKPAQILLMDLRGGGFKQAARQLAPYRPKVIRSGVLRDGGYALHVELVDLLKYLKHPRSL